jgi:cyclophilin family peptidyl-prolyl cis-trans isomerase/HEAT repeat protein
MSRARVLLAAFLLVPATARAQVESEISALAPVLAAEDARRYDEPLFRKTLADPDSFVRREAALGLGRLRDPRGIPLLAPLLRDPDSLVQATAAFALGLIGDTSALPLLIDRGRDPGPLSGTAALEFLTATARIGGDAAGDFSRSVLDGELWQNRDDAVYLVQRAALEAWRLGRAAPVASLLALVHADKDDTRYAVFYSLGRLRATAAAARLVDAAGDKSAPVRVVVAHTLTKAFVDSAGLDATAITDLLARLTRDADPGVRIQALRAMGTYHDPAVATPVLSLLDDPVDNVQVQAAITLGNLGGAPAAEALGRIAGDGKGAFELRREALIALAKVDTTAFVTHAGAWTAGKDWRQRAAVAEGWAAVDPRRLGGFLRDSDPRVIAAALQAWSDNARGADSAYVAACRQLARHRDAAVRTLAADGLGRALNPTDQTTLIGMVRLADHDSVPDAALSALRALAGLAHASGARATATDAAILSQLPLPRDYVVRRWAEENWPAAADRWGPAYPIQTGRSLSEYANVVRQFVAGLDSTRYPKVKAEIADLGVVELELFGPEAPLTVVNFLRLLDRGYFNGQRFHRVVPNFVVQAGDPRGDGWGGPGGTIRDEINRRRYGAYYLGMALSGPDTGGSQWFITLSPQPHLDGAYTIFGRVTDGMSVLLHVTQGDLIRSIHR